ncbi:MAG: hypothetical protein WCT14_09620, partial [Treponemataceae bacterium]
MKLAAQPYALETNLSGEWIDFASIEAKAELKANGMDNGLSFRGLYIDRRSVDKENLAVGGVELNVGTNGSVYFGAGPLRSTGLP